MFWRKKLTPREELEKIIEDLNSGNRRRIERALKNPLCPKHKLAEFWSRDQYGQGFGNALIILENPNCPDEFLTEIWTEMAEYNASHVRAVIKRKEIPEFFYNYLDFNMDGREFNHFGLAVLYENACEHKSCPPKFHEKYYRKAALAAIRIANE